MISSSEQSSFTEKAQESKRESQDKKISFKEREALKLAKSIQSILEKSKEERTKEDYLKIKEIAEKIEAIFSQNLIGWHKEGELTEEDIIVEYEVGGQVFYS